MIRLIRSEFLKLRTILLPFALLAGAGALTVFVAVMRASQAGASGHMAIPPLNTTAGLTAILTSTEFAMLLALVFGTIVASGEFRHGTATATYQAAPKRNRVLVAKAIAGAGFGLLFGLVGGGVATAVGVGFVSAHGFAVTVSGATMARYIGGAALGSAFLAAAGVGLGSLIRNQLAATITAFAWGFVVERIVGDLFFSSVARYFPFTAARTLAGASLGGTSALPFAWALVLVVGVAVVLLAVSAGTTVPRDVS